jgi:hypothetical protein
MSYTVTRPTEYTEKQLKGIDLSVRGLMRKFPFITGWNLHERHDEYKTMLKIEVYANLEKLVKSYNVKVSDYYFDAIKSGEMIRVYSPLVIANNFLEVRDLNLPLTNDIKDTLNKIYSNLPSDYQFNIFYKFDFDDKPSPSLVNLDIDEFVFK